MAASCRRIPLVILGATGTGKSKLAIEIGRALNGEIISTDSMQLYKGLNIVTNKVSEVEQTQCPHHMISYLSPLEYAHTVIDFRNRALPIIDGLLKEEKLPIIVGGTNYYIEALLWNFLINKQDVRKAQSISSDESNDDEDDTSQSKLTENTEADVSKNDYFVCRKEEDEMVTNMETCQLYKILQDKDPESAKKIHPHNRRKIIRVLEVHKDYGVKMSDIYNAQHEGTGSDKRGSLRYPHPCIIWIKTDSAVLQKRLDTRVGEMMEQGLLDELQDFHDKYTNFTFENKRKLDFELGIFQTIGFKEFHKYLILSDEEKKTDKGRQLLKEGEENLKIATRQYSRRQLRWINNRLLRKSGVNVPLVYSVDSTDVDRWDELVLKPALNIVNSVIQGNEPDIPSEPYKEEDTTQYQYNTCDVCDGRVFVVKFEWEAHINSRKHKKRLAKRRKLEGITHDVKRQKKTDEEET